jgi:hypothetical protein
MRFEKLEMLSEIISRRLSGGHSKCWFSCDQKSMNFSNREGKGLLQVESSRSKHTRDKQFDTARGWLNHLDQKRPFKVHGASAGVG